MDLTQQVKEQLEQYRAQGLDMATLHALEQAVYGNTTPLGLRRWKPEDKPQMADFNRDNEIIDQELRSLREELGNKENIGTPELISFLFEEGWSQENSSCRYWKNKEGQVSLIFAAQKSSEITSGETITTLPEGYRPNDMVSSISLVLDEHQGNLGNNRVVINPNGTIQAYLMGVSHPQNARIVLTSSAFIAAQ